MKNSVKMLSLTLLMPMLSIQAFASDRCEDAAQQFGTIVLTCKGHTVDYHGDEAIVSKSATGEHKLFFCSPELHSMIQSLVTVVKDPAYGGRLTFTSSEQLTTKQELDVFMHGDYIAYRGGFKKESSLNCTGYKRYGARDDQ